jgi:predicted nuclease with RNAse H fold
MLMGRSRVSTDRMRAENIAWAGVDVGASKGFDVAAIDGKRLLARPRRIVSVTGVVDYLSELRPEVVAVDSPRSPAPPGRRSRADERDLVAAGVCGIRYTPDEGALLDNEVYYGWILNGLRLYEALGNSRSLATTTLIECFPTASWSRLGGPKGKDTRARWSRRVLESQRLLELPPRMNQDARDAIGAAITAKLYSAGRTERFGEIVVPFRDPKRMPIALGQQMGQRAPRIPGDSR